MSYAPKLNGDVYAYLLSFVSSPSDLLAVCLANKELYYFAKPELSNRDLIVTIGNNAVWEYLLANPVQASRVRRLEIRRQNSSGYGPLNQKERLPVGQPYLDEALDIHPNLEEAQKFESLFILALRSMSNLESFTWDRWPPLINQGHDVLGENLMGIYSDDIWTTIRDYTQLTKLKVVDLGRRDAFYPCPHPIFESSLFDIKNLTHVDLKFYYSPVDLAEGTGTGINGGTNDGEGVLLPGRVKTDRLRQLLHSCQNLEWLSLSIFDREFLEFWGNPFTDISSILSDAIWPRLHTISLHDILVHSGTMANFLLRHPGITSLSAFLSLSEADLPQAPFSLDALQPNVLPKIETLCLPPQNIRSLMTAIAWPSTIRKLDYIEPCDWSNIDDEEDRDLYMLDDLWGVPENLRRNNCGQDGGHNWMPLVDMHNLRSLAVRAVRRFKQLEELAELTPDLQHLTIRRYSIQSLYNSPAPHTQWLPYLSRWSRLKTVEGIHLWPLTRGRASDLINVNSVAAEILAACPNIERVPWKDGAIINFRNGSFSIDSKQPTLI